LYLNNSNSIFRGYEMKKILLLGFFMIILLGIRNPTFFISEKTSASPDGVNKRINSENASKISYPVTTSVGKITDLPDRIDGSNRFAVASNISARWKQADTVVLANYLAFADALTATPLAYKLNAPIFLTHPNQLSIETVNQLKSLKVKNVVIVGGQGSVSEKIVSEISNLGVSKITRISGKDRFEVSRNIAEKIGLNDTVVFANGLVFADALTIAPYAATHSYPILLTKTNEIPVETKNAFKINKIKRSIVVGGEGSISQAVLNKLPGASRIGGKDRYEVASNVANTFGKERSKIYLATGLTFADALTGSVLAAKENAVILLSNTDRLPDSTVSVIKNKKIPVTVLGGTGSVKDSIVQELIELQPTKRPVLYVVPHQDDEILSYGVDIRNELSRGRQVQIILLTRGEDSGSRDIVNGQYDNESYNANLSGKKIYCQIHQTYHNPIKENYRDGSLTTDEFANARTEEYYRALKALGVPVNNIHTEFIPVGQYSGKAVSAIIEKYLEDYPNSDVRTFSSIDYHSAHALLGRVVEGMKNNGTLQKYQAKHFVSIYTDRFSSIKKPTDTVINRIQNQEDLQFLDNAIATYERFDPRNGYYAIGYHSVKSQFDALGKNPYVNSHY
jgi:N-acetylmuramoyl-L-alanine amidase